MRKQKRGWGGEAIALQRKKTKIVIVPVDWLSGTHLTGHLIGAPELARMLIFLLFDKQIIFMAQDEKRAYDLPRASSTTST